MFLSAEGSLTSLTHVNLLIDLLKVGACSTSSMWLCYFCHQALCVIVEPKKRRVQAPSAAQAAALVSCLAFPLEPMLVSDFMRQLTEERRQLLDGLSTRRKGILKTPSACHSLCI